jgi:tetratricopeptide (TPR) repeat protein
VILKKGIELFNRGDLAGAEKVFSAALKADPHSGIAAYLLGRAIFAQGRYAEAIAPLALARAAGTESEEAWRHLGHCFAMLNKETELLSLLKADDATPAWRFELIFQILSNRMALGDYEGARRLAGRLPNGPEYRMAGHFWMGCLEEGGRQVGLFRDAIAAAGEFQAAGHDSPLIADRLLPARGVEDDNFVRQGEKLALSLPPLNWHSPLPENPPPRGAYLAGCDAAYFELFAPACVASLAKTPGRSMHLHIVNPTEASFMLFETLRGEHGQAVDLRLTSESRNQGEAVYYACARFLRLPELLGAYRAPLVVVDIDATFTPPMLSLPEEVAAGDVALFYSDTPFPWLQRMAELVLVRDSEEGRAFAKLTASYLARKLEGPRDWTLDQAAIHSVLRSCARWRPGLKVNDLRGTFGLSREQAIARQGDFEQKRALRLATVTASP